MKNKYSGLTAEEQIKRYKKENKTLFICAIICTIVIVAISILFFVYELDKAISIGLLVFLPFSWWIGYYIPKKENKKRIKELEKNVKIMVALSQSKTKKRIRMLQSKCKNRICTIGEDKTDMQKRNHHIFAFLLGAGTGPVFLACLILMCVIGEVDVFSTAGLYRYSWLMWLVIPICIANIAIGTKQTKEERRFFFKNRIFGCILLPVCLFLGAVRFLPGAPTYDRQPMVEAEMTTEIDLPDHIKIATTLEEGFRLSYAKVLNQDERDRLEGVGQADGRWLLSLPDSILKLLPDEIAAEMETFDAFVLYNDSTGEYNTAPSEGTHTCVFLAYDKELGRFLLVDGWTLQAE